MRDYGKDGLHDIDISTAIKNAPDQKDKTYPYPFGFDPTFHRYRLGEPQRMKKPSNIFVCSMADLFGDWVPDEWIQEVFKDCQAAPQHRYLFLTKNPERYDVLSYYLPWNVDYGDPVNSSNMWFGFTAENQIAFDERADKQDFYVHSSYNSFVSLEPLQSRIDLDGLSRIYGIGWVIVGAETGSRKDKIIPAREWVENIVNACRESGVPVFLKNSLAKVWGEPLIQDYPEGLKGN